MKNNPSLERKTARGTIQVIQAEESLCKLESLKDRVLKTKGVLRVETNHVNHMISVEYDPGKVTIDKIRKKVMS